MQPSPDPEMEKQQCSSRRELNGSGCTMAATDSVASARLNRARTIKTKPVPGEIQIHATMGVPGEIQKHAAIGV